MTGKITIIWYLIALAYIAQADQKGDEDDSEEEDLLNSEDVYKTTDPKRREPSPCEVCKFFTTELRDRLALTSKSKEVIETGHGLERKKKFKYLTSELRLTEALHDPHICEMILKYNVHAERKGSLRYAKGMSETFQTLHGLVNKGVKVDLGIPEDLWDKPSAEVSKMHRACFKLAEDYEEDIDEWYYNHQNTDDIVAYLCKERYLKGKDDKCLIEENVPKADGEDEDAEELAAEDKKKKKKKKKKGKGKKNLKGDTTASDEPPSAPGEESEDRHGGEL